MRICIAWDDAGKAARNKTLTTAQVRNVFNQILQSAGDEPLESLTVRDWAAQWLDAKKGARADSTTERYRKPVDDFLKHLGKRADLPIASVRPADVLAFRDAQRKGGRAASTVNFAHKAVASLLAAAVRQGYLANNPARAVDYLQTHRERIEKGTFTPAEITAILKACPSRDWRGVVMVARFAGLRLSDCLSLTWGNVDFEHRAIRIVPRKTARTGKALCIPLADELEDFLLKHPSGLRDADPVFPSVAKLGTGGNRGASMAFKRILEKAGVVSGVAREAFGAGGRAVSERSFHSLRHGFVSALQAAGVSIKIQQQLAGHSSAEQTLHYSHPDYQELQSAIKKLNP